MASIIDALLITLGVDPSGVTAGMGQARDAVREGVSGAANEASAGIKKTEDRVTSGVKGLLSQIAGPLVALTAGVVTFGAILQRVSGAVELGKLSKQLNVGVEDLQAWQGAAIQAGGSAEGLVESAKALREKTGSRIPITQQLLQMSDVLRTMPEMRAMEFGKAQGFDEGTIKLLRQGREAVQGMLAQQRELVAFTAKDVEAIGKVKLAYESFKSMLSSVGNVIIKGCLPPLRWLGDQLTKVGGVAPWVRDKLSAISAWVDRNGPHIQDAFTVIAAVITARMVPALWGMARAAVVAMLPFLPFILAVGALVLVFNSLQTYLRGGKSALSGFFSVFGTGPELAEKLRRAWDGVVASLSKFKNLLPAIGAGVAFFAVYKVVGGIFAGISAAIGGVKAAFTALRVVMATNPLGVLLLALGAVIVYWDDTVAGVKLVGATVQEWMGKAGAWVQENFGAAIKTVSGWIDSLLEKWNTVAALPGKIKESVKGAAGRAADALGEGIDTVKGWVGWRKSDPAAPDSASAKSEPAPRAFLTPASAAPPALAVHPSAAAQQRPATNVQAETNINQLTIQTQATDAQGIMRDASSAATGAFNKQMVYAATNGQHLKG